jgi:hypothetical protein
VGQRLLAGDLIQRQAEPGRHNTPARKEWKIMFDHYAVMYIPEGKKLPKCEVVYARSVYDAKKTFLEIYRHGDYNILAVKKMPEDF